MNNVIRFFVCLAIGLSSSLSFAQESSYGTLISGSFQPTGTFATLSTNTTDSITYNFTLQASDLNTLFTDGSFIGALAIDLGTTNLTPAISNVTGSAPVSVALGGGPGGIYEFRFGLSEGQDRLAANEAVSWTATFSQAVNVASIAMHVQGLTDAQGGSAWYGATPVTAVPEPETYALMLAGLGLMGAVARRRKAKLTV